MIDKASLVVAFIFIVAFFVHVINDNIPPFVEIWPAGPSAVHKMNAVVYNKSGSTNNVLSYDSNHPRPLINSNQVLVEVMYSAINPVDYKLRRFWIPGFLLPKPKIPGMDISGEIVEVGTSVKKEKLHLQVGDRVAAMMPMFGTRWGALAGYAAVDASLVAKMGDNNTSYPQAAALPLAALTAVQALEQLDPAKCRSILIQAGDGDVGIFAIQYAKHVLKIQTVATTASAGKADLLKELGADLVIDYQMHKFEEIIQDYDAVLDPMSWTYEKRTIGKGVLKPSGHYLSIGSSDWSHGLLMVKNLVYCTIMNLIRTGRVPKYSLIIVEPNGKRLQSVMDVVDKGFVKPVIDRTFPLSDAAEAFLYLEQGHATGKVILDHAKS